MAVSKNKAISGNKNTSFREKSPKLGEFRGHKCGTFFQGNVLSCTLNYVILLHTLDKKVYLYSLFILNT